MSRKAVWLALAMCFVLGFAAKSAVAQQTLFWDASGEYEGTLMEASYSEFYYADLVDQSLEVRVWNAPPLKQLKVIVRGTPLGVIRTNSLGFGKFYKVRIAVPVGDDDRPDAPRIETGDLIQVGKLKKNIFVEGEFMPR